MFLDIKNISSHLNKLSNRDWEKLFSLIPQIEETEKFIKGGGLIEDVNDPNSFIITPIIEIKIVHDFQKVLAKLGLIINFDWSGWDEGRIIAKKMNFENLDTVTLLKLLTAFVRNNRFCDGALAARFEDRTIEKILKEVKKNIERK